MKSRLLVHTTVGLLLVGPLRARGAGLETFGLELAARERIDAQLPDAAPAHPQRPRRLLIFDLNVGYGGHGSIPYANYAVTRTGQRTGAYETVVSRDPAMFGPDTLRGFDAVFLNNTVGNLFTDPELRRRLLEFVYSGGGLLGVHGTSVAFTRWPGAHEDWVEFGRMIGARGASHRESDEDVFSRIEDPTQPLTAMFPATGFRFRDEYFRFQDPYSRHRVRVLLSFDTERTDMNQGPPRGDCVREDNDYAVAWIRQYGRGRTFYSTIAHNPYVFWNPDLLRFYLAAIQFALGDLAGPTLPSARLTPSQRAQERLGWRVGSEGRGSSERTLFEQINRAAAGGIAHLCASTSWTVSDEIPRPLDFHLADADREKIRLALDDAGLRLLGLNIGRVPSADADCAAMFAFARRMGVEVVIVQAGLDELGVLAAQADLQDLKVAVQGGPDANRAAVRSALAGLSPRIGFCADVTDFGETEAAVATGLRQVGDRLVILRCGAGTAAAGEPESADQVFLVLDGMKRLQLKPVMISVCQPGNDESDVATESPRVQWVNEATLKLARTSHRSDSPPASSTETR